MNTGFIVVMVLIAVIVGMRLERIREKKRSRAESQGVLYVNCAYNDREPSLFLEPNVPISDIAAKKQVIFDVDVIEHNSHK